MHGTYNVKHWVFTTNNVWLVMIRDRTVFYSRNHIKPIHIFYT
jgi:hypothetical protein